VLCPFVLLVKAGCRQGRKIQQLVFCTEQIKEVEMAVHAARMWYKRNTYGDLRRKTEGKTPLE
jgi:hypothetical protein